MTVRFIDARGEILTTKVMEIAVPFPPVLVASVGNVAAEYDLVGENQGVLLYQNKRDPLLVGCMVIGERQ